MFDTIRITEVFGLIDDIKSMLNGTMLNGSFIAKLSGEKKSGSVPGILKTRIGTLEQLSLGQQAT